jgi:hypothetical protein
MGEKEVEEKKTKETTQNHGEERKRSGRGRGKAQLKIGSEGGGMRGGLPKARTCLDWGGQEIKSCSSTAATK